MHDDAAILAQLPGHRSADRSRRHGLIAGQILVDEAGVASHLVVVVQQIGQRGELFHALHHLGLDGGAGTLQLLQRRRGLGQLGQFSIDQRLDFVQRFTRTRDHLDTEHRTQRQGFLRDLQALRQLAFVDQLFVEPAGLAAAEDVGGHIEIGVARLEHGRGVPGQIQPRQLDLVADFHALLGADLRLRHQHRRYWRTCLQRAEIFFDHLPGLGRLEIAGQHQRGVVRAVVGASKGLHVSQLDRLDVGM